MSETDQELEQEHEPGDEVEGVPVEPVAPVEADEEEAEHEEQQEIEQSEGVRKLEEPQALSEKELEKAFAKLDREAQRHQARVQEIMGDDAAVLVACPLCEPLIPGFVMPTPATPERFPAVRTFMGDAQPQEWQQDPNTHTCQTCDGMGEVKTGSKVQSQATLVCTDCGGKGWQGARAPIVTSGPMAVQPLPEGNGQAEVTPQGPEPPEAQKLRELGYTLIQPVGA